MVRWLIASKKREKKTDKGKIAKILAGILIIGGLLWYLGVIPLGAFGDSVTIYNDGKGPLTCYVNVYNDGRTFTIPQGGSKTISIDHRALGRCYCPETYTDYDVIDSYITYSFHISRFNCAGGATICDVWSYDTNKDCYIGGWEWSVAYDDFYAGKISELCEYEIHQIHLNDVKRPGCSPIITTTTNPHIICTPNEVQTKNYRCIGTFAYYDNRQCYPDGSGWGNWATSYDRCASQGKTCVNGKCVTDSISTTTTLPPCQNLWWFDDASTVCGYKQFCGSFMYHSLQVFTTEEACKEALGDEGIPPGLIGIGILIVMIIGGSLYLRKR